MKSVYHLIFTSLVFLSCLDAPTKYGDTVADANLGEDLAFFTQKTKKHYYVDGKTGLVVCQKEYPSDWDIVTKPIYNLDKDFPTFLYLMQNNKGMKAFNTPRHQFVSFQNPQYAQMMQGYGVTNIRPYMSPETFVAYEIRPMMEQNGFKFLSERQFPNILALLDEQKQKYGMTNFEFNLYCTEWINKDNVKALVSFNQLVLNYDASVTMKVWSYQMAYFFAPMDIYETDLKITLQSDLDMVESQNWQRYQMEVNNFRQEQKNAEHRRAMIAGSNASDVSHRRFIDNIRGTSSSTSYASNSSHSTFIDMIREEQNVSLEGKTFKVEAGAENYWMNSDGKYIKSDDQFYDPNRDGLYNNQRWNLTTKQR